MTDKDDPRWATAVHEAGHAVAAHSLGRGIRSVSIIEDSDSLGRVVNHSRARWSERLELADYGISPGGFVEGRLRRAVETDVIISLAGGLTVIELLDVEEHDVAMGLTRLTPAMADGMATRHGGKAKDYERLIVGGDLQHVVAILDRISVNDEETAAYLSWLERRTLTLVRSLLFRCKVETVARELCQRGILSGRSIGELIAQVQADQHAADMADWRNRTAGRVVVPEGPL